MFTISPDACVLAWLNGRSHSLYSWITTPVLRAIMSVSCSTKMAMTPPEWRQLWRKRGLAVDKLLPYALAVPKPSDEALLKRLPATVCVPGETERLSLDDNDRAIALEGADFVSGFIAEELPAEVLGTDLKLPSIASALAVQNVGTYGAGMARLL